MNDNFKWKALFLLIAVGNLSNGLWMLANPNHWYLNLPGRIPDFGPMNEHLIRDLACIFVLFGIISVKAAFIKSSRKSALLIIFLWYLGHASVHVLDTLRGFVAIEHFYVDIPLVYAPTIIIGTLLILIKNEDKKHA